MKSIAGIGNTAFFALFDRFGSIEAVFSASAGELTTTPGINKKSATAIAGFKGWVKIRRDLDIIDKAGIKIITHLNELYPANLINVYDRPAFLYVRGNLKKDDINIAIVGSRLASTYGKYTTEKISRELAYKGTTIVSGMARGIDSAAHRGALAAQGRTIAVLGSGLDIVYPPENKKLFDTIIENGAAISEFPLGTPPRSNNFPARNRIISGMSYGVLVVEAGEKSGSLITARLALEQGREVFAVPGPIYSGLAKGPAQLIKQGAKLVMNVGDILEELNIDLRSKMLDLREIKGDTEEEQTILDLLRNGPTHIDEIARASKLPASKIGSILSLMEIKGKVKNLGSGSYSLPN